MRFQICVVQSLASILEIVVLTTFMTSRCAYGEAQTAQWFPCVVMALVFEGLRWYAATISMVVERRQERRDPNAMPVTIISVCLCTCVLAGLYSNLTYFPWFKQGHDECSETWSSWMRGMAFWNIGLSVWSAVGLVTDRSPSQPASSSLEARPPQGTSLSLITAFGKRPVISTPGERLSQVTLQTFIVEAQGSERNPIQECIICLKGPYAPGEVVTELRCHHTFHSSCIASWIQHGGQGCPMRCEAVPRRTPQVYGEEAV